MNGVNTTRAHVRHAVRVAAIATVIVMVGYVIAAMIVNLVVTDRLLGRVDSRLMDGLRDAQHQTLTLPGKNSAPEVANDVDDAPVFFWSISPSGAVTPLTPGAPTLPSHQWNGSPVTLPAGTSMFRFDSLDTKDGVYVAGESVAGTQNVQSTLLVAELVFGAILAVAAFVGSTIVGLRASAPSELVRRRQAEFTADASHELRTPISVIDAEVGLALDRPREPAAYRDVLERVREESARLRQIVEDLLWLARADDEPVDAGVSEVVDVAETLESCVERFAALAAKNHVALSVSRSGNGPFTVQAQSELVDRLAGVLIDNACKFAGDGGRVEVSARGVGGRVSLRVDDSGPGIPEEQREAVFDRFHRATDSVTGTGLGLAIADSVVRATHGSWDIGVAELGGARMEVLWRRTVSRRAEPSVAPETLSGSVS